MDNYPVVVADNFFEDVDYVVKLAHQQKYEPDPYGAFPGKRSKPIAEIDIVLQRFITEKILKLYYNTIESCSCASFFQLIDSDLDYGWVHNDNPTKITSVIYLYYEKQETNSGTSFYLVKKDKDKKDTTSILDENDIFKAKDYISNKITLEGKQAREYCNQQFVKTIDVNNVFNRCIVYPSSMYHSQNDINCSNNPRLTIVSFITDIFSKELAPLDRMRKKNDTAEV